MTRIGFAYNQKPDSPVGLVGAITNDARAEEDQVRDVSHERGRRSQA
jgi:hypothetical protein